MYRAGVEFPDLPVWMNSANAWLSLPLTVIGFAVAIVQATRAQTSAAAAERAADRAATDIREKLVLVVLPSLLQIESAAEAAIARGDSAAVVAHFSQWRWHAGQARGLFSANDPEVESFLVAIQSSIAICAESKIVIGSATDDLTKRTRAAMRAIAQVTGMVGEMSSKHSTQAGRSHG